MSETIFSKIIRGDLPCHRVYENEDVLAFLDIFPVSLGHTLVIPKAPAVRLSDMSDESAAALGRALPRIARAVCDTVGVCDYTVVQKNGEPTGQVVMHVHFHIIPKHADGTGVSLDWKPGKLEDEEGQKLAAKMANAIVH